MSHGPRRPILKHGHVPNSHVSCSAANALPAMVRPRGSTKSSGKPASFGNASNGWAYDAKLTRRKKETRNRVAKAQRSRLDFVYLAHWAEDLGVADLLSRLLQDAGLRSGEEAR